MITFAEYSYYLKINSIDHKPETGMKDIKLLKTIKYVSTSKLYTRTIHAKESIRKIQIAHKLCPLAPLTERRRNINFQPLCHPRRRRRVVTLHKTTAVCKFVARPLEDRWRVGHFCTEKYIEECVSITIWMKMCIIEY